MTGPPPFASPAVYVIVADFTQFMIAKAIASAVTPNAATCAGVGLGIFAVKAASSAALSTGCDIAIIRVVVLSL